MQREQTLSVPPRPNVPVPFRFPPPVAALPVRSRVWFSGVSLTVGDFPDGEDDDGPGNNTNTNAAVQGDGLGLYLLTE